MSRHARAPTRSIPRAPARLPGRSYSTVFEHSAEFGSRKLAAATELKGPLEAAIEELQAAIVALQAEADKAAALVETLEYRAAEEARRSEAKAKDVAELERSNAMLEQLLEVSPLNPPASPLPCPLVPVLPSVLPFREWLLFPSRGNTPSCAVLSQSRACLCACMCTRACPPCTCPSAFSLP